MQGDPQQSSAMSIQNVVSIGAQTSQTMLAHGSIGPNTNANVVSGMSNSMAVNVTGSGSGNSGMTGMGTSGMGAVTTPGAGQQMSAADISLMLSLGLGLNHSEAQQLANWDLQKLAMILVSNI